MTVSDVTKQHISNELSRAQALLQNDPENQDARQIVTNLINDLTIIKNFQGRDFGLTDNE